MLPAAHSVGEWSVHDVGEWVGRTSGLADIRGALAANHVDGIALLCLDANDASSASRLGLPSPFVFRHLCLRRDELLASLAESAVDSLMIEAMLSQPPQSRGFRETLYELVRPRRRFHLPAPRRSRQAHPPPGGDFELEDAVPGAMHLAPRDRPAILTGVC